MALDSDAEDASPTTALKEFEANICFLQLSGLWPVSAAFPISWSGTNQVANLQLSNVAWKWDKMLPVTGTDSHKLIA